MAAGIASQRVLGVSECCNDTDCTHSTMKQGFHALTSGEWEEFQNTLRNEVKVSEWAFHIKKEAFDKVAKDEARKLSTVQEVRIPGQLVFFLVLGLSKYDGWTFGGQDIQETRPWRHQRALSSASGTKTTSPQVKAPQEKPHHPTPSSR